MALMPMIRVKLIRGHCMSNFVTCSSYASNFTNSRRSFADRGHKCDKLGSYEAFT